MTLEQPLTNGAPPVLELVQGAAITPIHHIYVDGVWRQVRVAAARAARAEAATGTPFIEFLGGGPHHTVPVPPRILHPVGLQSRYAPSRQLPTGQRTVGCFIGMQNAARTKLPPTRFPSIILQYGVWVCSTRKNASCSKEARETRVGYNTGGHEALYRDPSGTSL